MDEATAKTKWCPFVVASHTNPRQRAWVDGDVGEPTGTLHHNCLGSECMAWRPKFFPTTVHRLNDDGSVAYSFAAEDPEHFLGSAEYRVEPGFTGGFCGLAGAPK